MTTAGIICEFNPFHNGHARLISKARERGADRVIALMSGDYVQRGEPAAFSRWVRTKMALLGGADVVLALPSRYATSSAEQFAGAGVDILNRLGGHAREDGDDMVIQGVASLKGGCRVDVRSDHRMVMLASIAATVCEQSVEVEDTDALNKSWPEYLRVFADLGGRLS